LSRKKYHVNWGFAKYIRNMFHQESGHVYIYADLSGQMDTSVHCPDECLNICIVDQQLINEAG